MDLNKMSTSQLLELYNRHSDKKVNKFTDKKTALRRVGDLLASLKAHGCDEELAIVTADAENKPTSVVVQPEPNPEHKYVPQLRPVTFASLPEGVRWDYVETPSDGRINRPDLPLSWHRFGVVMLSRALTDEEMSHFDLKPYTAQPTATEKFQQPITMPAPKLDAPKAKSERTKGSTVIQRIQEMMKQPNGVSEPEVCKALNWKAAGATIMRAIKAADFEVRKFRGDDKRTRYAAVA